MCPRVCSKVIPHNPTRLSDVKNVVKFIFRYAEDHTILLLGRIPSYKYDDLQLLSSSTTKHEVWQLYHQASLASPYTTAVCYSLICALWKQLTPQVVVTRPMSHLCWTCQQNITLIHIYTHICYTYMLLSFYDAIRQFEEHLLLVTQ